MNVFDQFEAVLVRKGNVSQHQIRLAGHQNVERLPGCVRFATHREIRLVTDQLRQALAHHRMVVHDEDSLLNFWSFVFCGHVRVQSA
jgi:hypothetical protein